MPKSLLVRLKRHGQGLVEYGLILLLFVVVAALILGFIAIEVIKIFSETESALQ